MHTLMYNPVHPIIDQNPINPTSLYKAQVLLKSFSLMRTFAWCQATFDAFLPFSISGLCYQSNLYSIQTKKRKVKS